MHSKSLLIAIAALALTATGAQAFTGEALVRAGLSEDQRAAFEVARELREEGDVDAARDVLVEAGIDDSVIERVRTAMSSERHESRAAMHAALEADDYEAFLAAIADSPLADIVTSEEDFTRFKEAHALKMDGKTAEAQVIFQALGLPNDTGRGGARHGGHAAVLDELTEEQQAAFAVAKVANDRDAMHAILEEAGVAMGERGGAGPQHLRDGREIGQ